MTDHFRDRGGNRGLPDVLGPDETGSGTTWVET